MALRDTVDKINSIFSYTHMPFIFEDMLLFCACDELGKWKAYIAKEEEIYPFGDLEISCSPIMHKVDDYYFISLIGKYGTGPYNLYSIKSDDLINFDRPELIYTGRKSGYVFNEYKVVNENEDMIQIKYGLKEYILFSPGSIISRLSPVYNKPNVLLITESYPDTTIEYDLDKDTQYEIVVNDSKVYKCSISGNRILYTEKTGDNYEGRKIRYSDSFDKKPIYQYRRYQVGGI